MNTKSKTINNSKSKNSKVAKSSARSPKKSSKNIANDSLHNMPIAEINFETPEDGDLIYITTTTSTYRIGPYIYRENFEDAENHVLREVVVFNSAPNKHEIICSFQDVIIWEKQEGESTEDYEKRKKNLIPDKNGRFTGANDIQGSWSKEKRGPSHGPTYPFNTPPDGERIIALLRRYIFVAGTFHLKSNERENFLDNVVFLPDGFDRGDPHNPVEFLEVRGWKPFEKEQTFKIAFPGPLKRFGMSAHPEEFGWEGSGDTLEEQKWEWRDRKLAEASDAYYKTAQQRWEYWLKVFNVNWKDALDRTGRIRVVDDFLKRDAWWRSDPLFYWPSGRAKCPVESQDRDCNFEILLNTQKKDLLREQSYLLEPLNLPFIEHWQGKYSLREEVDHLKDHGIIAVETIDGNSRWVWKAKADSGLGLYLNSRIQSGVLDKTKLHYSVSESFWFEALKEAKDSRATKWKRNHKQVNKAIDNAKRGNANKCVVGFLSAFP
jgi:hypothetical protein